MFVEIDISLRMDIIVCIDACFTQKRMRDKETGQQSRIPIIHPDTFFLTREEVEAMENHVSGIRDGHTTQQTRDGHTTQRKGHTVPASVIEECHKSFTAADERREKASTKFFADTALMAMLCRHDNVLYVANMTSAGEKQHYAVALLDRLFGELPHTTRVGVLYDIACQLHTSLEKWNFLPNYSARIEYGVSVFHASGHEWICQIVYHPRKRKGFGRSDGEGCERFWWKLSPLIPNLRVSGYYVRLYTLDKQMHVIREGAFEDAGHWLQRKWRMTTARQKVLEKEWNTLQERVNFDEEDVMAQWDEQLEKQTQAVPSHVKDLGKKVILELVALEDSVRESKNEQIQLANALDSAGLDVEEVLDRQEALRLKISKEEKIIKKRIAALSTGERANYLRLQDDEFLAIRVGALGLKRRIRQKLQGRRFEIIALKRHEVQKHKESRKLTENAMANLKRREPSLKKLVQKYNQKCQALVEKLKGSRRPRHVKGLAEIDLSTIWELDVDDDIWNDALYLDDEEEKIPEWLGNEDMRGAIRNRVENERCKEELVRLLKERNNLRSWMVTEWRATKATMEFDQDEWLMFQLELKLEKLALLAGRWEKAVEVMKEDLEEEDWGPSREILIAARAQEKEMRRDVFVIPEMRRSNDQEMDDERSESGSEVYDEEDETEEIITEMYNLELEGLAAEHSMEREYF